MRWPAFAAIGLAAVLAGAALAALLVGGDGDDDGGQLTDPTAATASPTAIDGNDEGFVEPTGEGGGQAPATELVAGLEISSGERDAAFAVVQGYRGSDGDRYTPVGFVATTDTRRRQLLAVLGVSRDSTDGSIQRIFYFLDGDYQGTDWEGPVVSVASIRALENGQLEVTYNRYADGAVVCCPSGTFTWFAFFDGSGENPEGPPGDIFAG
ncbi:MAG: LppP/LprE family lipoprotein [Dehalococcoidia bacterium]